MGYFLRIKSRTRFPILPKIVLGFCFVLEFTIIIFILFFLCQFLNDKLIPLQILYPSLVSWKITPLYFFSSNNIYLAQKEPIKIKFFETFECSGQNLSHFLCQFWKDKSIPLQILYPYSVLNSYFSYFGLKDPINISILRLSIALVKICHIPHFPHHKSVFFQILHHSSVS